MTSTLFSPDEAFTNQTVRCIPAGNFNETIQYNVKTSDTLCSIAVTHNTTKSALMHLNKLPSDSLYPGQVLMIPTKREESHLPNPAVTPLVVPKLEDLNFLPPLSGTSMLPNSYQQKPDLMIVTSSDQQSNGRRESDSSKKIPSSIGSREKSSESSVRTDELSECKSIENRDTAERRRMFSNDSCQSESLEENFVKMTVEYVTGYNESVFGILLITPTSAMFDPDPASELCRENGCERYGIMCNLHSVCSIAVYNEIRVLRESSVSSQSSPSNQKDDVIDRSRVDEPSPEVIDRESDVGSGEEPVESDSRKLMFEFPLLHSLVKTVEDYLPGITQYAEGRVKPNGADEREKKFLYLCIKSQDPMVRTFSLLTLNDGSHEGDSPSNDEVRECWFKFPEDRSDQLFSFFMQWSPDSYALDFTEYNGFLDADTLEKTKSNKNPVNSVKEGEKRSRSSTDSSLVFIEDYFSDKEIMKEWELISLKEAERRSKLNANELANDDSSLLPEMLHTSNLIRENTLLELCRHIPARCVGCPWRLLYSTYEHGMSLKTLYRKMNQRYEDSPAVVVIQDSQNHIFGALCSTRPRVSDHFYGSGESFLFTLDPNFEVFQWSGENSFFIKGDSDALMFGGGDGTAGLWLDGDLNHGRSIPCLTFNNSILSSSEDFFISGVEVWGFDNS